MNKLPKAIWQMLLLSLITIVSVMAMMMVTIITIYYGEVGDAERSREKGEGCQALKYSFLAARLSL